MIVGLAVFADAIASGITLMAFFQANNILSQGLLFSGGCIITGLVIFTKEILESDSFLLKLIWFMAVAVDAYTTVVGVIFYVIIGKQLAEPVDLSIIHYDPTNWPKTIIVFFVTGIVTGASITSLYVLEKFRDKL
jgi:H+/Cl- antiporter ClcA